MKLGDLLQQVGRIVAYSPRIAEMVQSVQASLFLCQACYWRNKEDKRAFGWFYKTSDQIREETGLSYLQQQGARKRLKELGILEERYQRNPNLMFFRVNIEALETRWAQFVNDNDNAKIENIGLPLSVQTVEMPRSERRLSTNRTSVCHDPSIHQITHKSTHEKEELPSATAISSKAAEAQIAETERELRDLEGAYSLDDDPDECWYSAEVYYKTARLTRLRAWRELGVRPPEYPESRKFNKPLAEEISADAKLFLYSHLAGVLDPVISLNRELYTARFGSFWVEFAQRRAQYNLSFDKTPVQGWSMPGIDPLPQGDGKPLPMFGLELAVLEHELDPYATLTSWMAAGVPRVREVCDAKIKHKPERVKS